MPSGRRIHDAHGVFRGVRIEDAREGGILVVTRGLRGLPALSGSLGHHRGKLGPKGFDSRYRKSAARVGDGLEADEECADFTSGEGHGTRERVGSSDGDVPVSARDIDEFVVPPRVIPRVVNDVEVGIELVYREPKIAGHVGYGNVSERMKVGDLGAQACQFAVARAHVACALLFDGVECGCVLPRQ